MAKSSEEQKSDSLKRKLVITREEVMNIWKQGKSALKEPLDAQKVLTFKGMFRVLEKYYSKYEATWEELCDLPHPETGAFPSKDDEKSYNNTRAAYYECQTNFEFILKKEREIDRSTSSITAGFGDTTITLSNDSNLQPIPLHSFDGQILEWPRFRDLFVSLIHNNDKISPIKKFHYLVRSLEGPAATVVSAFKLEEQNYQLAWEALKANFENKRMLASGYLNKILLSKPSSRGTPDSLKKFLVDVADNIAAFKRLEIPTESDFILFHIAVRNLDSRTREQFENANKGVDFPKFDDLSKFVRERVVTLQLTENQNDTTPVVKRSDDPRNLHRRLSNYKSQSLVTSDAKPSRPSSGACFVCNATPSHNLSHCSKFKAANLQQRLQWMENWKGCRNCLAHHHVTSSCTSKFNCRHCSARHHSMIHSQVSSRPPSTPSSSAPQLGTSEATLNVVGGPSRPRQILLGTAIAEIKDVRGIYHHIRIVVDSASQNSFITSRMITRLGLPSSYFKRIISGIGDTLFSGAKGNVDCTLRSRGQGAQPLHTSAVVVDEITTHLPTCDLPVELYSRYVEFELADPYFYTSSRVDFLLGAELFSDIWTGRVTNIGDGFPKVFSTIFGDIVIGGCSLPNPHELSASLLTTMPTSDLHDSLKTFWETEEPLIPIPSNPDDQAAEDHFQSTHYRTSSGQYVVRLPFKEQPPVELSSSSESARRLFYNLESRLARNPQLRCDYAKFMHEYHDLGHMSLTTSPSRYVIPHHAVSKEDRNQVKIRVVFNSSWSTRDSHSLNHYQLTGRKLQTNIFLILLNYRIHPIVFSVDIVKFFRGILVDPQDRAYQHVYWRSDPAQPLNVYELNTVTYGQRSSPFLSIRVLHALKEDEGKDFPLAAKILVDDVYVDDYLTGSHSVKSALELQSQLIGIMKRAGFSLSKWSSNSRAILQSVDHPSTDPITIDNAEEIEPKIKILGLQWDPNVDSFSYRINRPGAVSTKRGVLSEVAKIYDPLGFLTPAVIRMKMFIQDIWKEGLDWDQRLSEKMQSEWDALISELPNLSKVSLPRFVGSDGPCDFQVVGFADASQNGYCAVLYLRTTSENETKIHLLTAKSKLAPVRTISIPRLELQGAHLLARLYQSILPFLERLSPTLSPPIFLTDSSIVLGWLSTPPYQLKTFVANRVTEIIERIPIGNWRHVDSQDNPADCGSRGTSPNELLNHRLWWSGPQWLSHSEERWPPPTFSTPKSLPEVKTSCLLITRQSANSFIEWMNKFSSYRSLLRVVAVLARGISKRDKPVPRLAPLSVEDMRHALVCCVKIIQLYYFIEDATDHSTKMRRLFGNLCPFQDKDGLWRVGGRLRHSQFDEGRKHPILLPTKSHFVTILVDYYHRSFLHASPTIIHAMIQIRFWVPSLRRVVRRRTQMCITCARQNAKSSSPLMADLPSFRVTGSRCFSHVGVDFAGPFTMRESLRRKAQTSKVYLCLFVCMQTKAVHLEAVTQLSTAAFMASFDRFISRRGLPTNVYSDSGTNFVGAANLLRNLYLWLRESSTHEDIRNYALEREIKWHFNPPLAPHFGGLWESGVRSVKRLMRVSAGDTPLTYEELATLFARYEAILNSRPLCPVSSDPEEVDYLTPGHFMVGGNLIAYPEPILLDCKENTLDRWQLVKRLHQHFWSKWSTEYLSTLQKRAKWTKNCPSLQVGDLVLMKKPSLPTLQWPTARVTELHPGDDGIVRVVSVMTPTRQTYRRPVVQLVPLLSSNSSSYNP